MANNNDYGYFGKGTEGYAHYKQAFDRNWVRAKSLPAAVETLTMAAAV